MRIKKSILIFTASVFIIYMISMGLYYVTSEPSFCGKCHLVKPYVTSWEQSPHKDVNCMFCHEERGFLGKLDSKLRGVNNLYQQATNQYTVITRAKVFEQNCIACHLEDNNNFPDAPKLNNNISNRHFGVVMNGTSCLVCHAEVWHKNRFYITPEFNKLWK